MNKLTLLVLSCLFAASIAAQNTAEAKKTDENIKKEKRELGSFNKVKTTKGINVTLVAGEKEMIEVHIQNANPSDVVTELAGKTLTLKMKTKIYKDMAVQVYVTYKELIELNAGIGSSIDCDGAVIGDRINLIAGTDASIELELYMKSVEASLSASRIELSGETGYQEVKANSGATYNATELVSKEALVKTNTGATANINVTEKLTATAGAASQIYYMGKAPQLIKTLSMGGKVESID